MRANGRGPRDAAGGSSRGASRLAPLLALLAVVVAIGALALLVVFRASLGAWLGGAPAAARAGERSPSPPRRGTPEAPGGSRDDIAFYTCSMHPSVRQREPGRCPICGMDLAPVRRAEAASAEVVLDDGRREELGIRLGVVSRRPLDEPVRAIGRVAYDESLLADVTVKFPGYATALGVSQVGQRVARGQVLLNIYSPDLYLAQQEYLVALASQSAARRSSAPDRADYLVAAAAQKLKLWDLSDEDITHLNERHEPSREVPVRSPASGVVIAKDIVAGGAVQPGMRLYRIASLDRVWLEAQVYQSDLPRVRVGQRAAVRLSALPGRVLGGHVVLVSPAVDPASRTAQVRIELANPRSAAGPALLPDMAADVELAAAGGEVLVVPEGAVLDTGERTLVFVDEGGGRFHPRSVRLGARSGDSYAVLSGLKAGERVVTSGQFLLDAESRLKAPERGPAL